MCLPVALVALQVTLAAAMASPRLPRAEYLGLRLGMSRHDASERLERMSHPASGAASEDEEGGMAWTLTDSTYRSALVGFDPTGHVEWFRLSARPGGRAVLMRQLGDLREARQRGNYIYVWSFPARGRRSAYQVIARSENPDTLQSLTVLKLPLSRGGASVRSHPDSLGR